MKIFTESYKLLLPVVLFLTILFSSCENQPNTPNNNENTVSGVIVDEQGISVPSAILSVYNPNAAGRTELAKDTSDEDGKFSLTNLPTDISALNVKILHKDFKPFEEKFSDFKQKTSNPVQLCHEDTCKGVLNIWTFKSSDSTKLSDVEVRLYRDGSLIKKGLTKDGIITFSNVCPGDYILKYSKYHFGSVYDSLSTSGSDTVNLHQFLVQTTPDSCCNGKIFINVKDSATNSALSSVKAYLMQSGTYVSNTYSDSLGRIIFISLCPGDYTVSLFKRGYNNGTLAFKLGCNDSAGADIKLSVVANTDSCCKGILKVFLLDKSTGKAPAKGVTVNLVQNGKVIQTQTSTAYAYFSKICQGSYQVHITSTYYETLQFDYTSHCNAVDTTTKYLTPIQHTDTCCHGVIDVVVKDSATKAALKGAGVYLYQGSTKISAISTDANGYVHFTGICEGEYTIKSSLTGYNYNYITIKMGCNDSSYNVQYLSKTHTTDTCCTGKLTVTVKDSTDGSAIAGATVYLMKTDGTAVTGTTDANGQYIFNHICAPYTYKVKAVMTDYNYNYVQVTFKDCTEQSIKIKIQKK